MTESKLWRISVFILKGYSTALFLDKPKIILISRKGFTVSQLHTRIPRGVVYALLEVHCTAFLCGIWQHAALGSSQSVYTESRLYNFKGGDRFLEVC